MKSEQINELAKALASAQELITGAKKDSDNPFFKSRYADLGSVWDSIRKPLSSNGLSVAQTVDGDKLITLLMHSSGQWIDSSYPISAKDGSPQAIGSAITYARRYALAAIVGAYQTDDDAEAATERKPQNTAAGPQPTQRPSPVRSVGPAPKVNPSDGGFFA